MATFLLWRILDIFFSLNDIFISDFKVGKVIRKKGGRTRYIMLVQSWSVSESVLLFLTVECRLVFLLLIIDISRSCHSSVWITRLLFHNGGFSTIRFCSISRIERELKHVNVKSIKLMIEVDVDCSISLIIVVELRYWRVRTGFSGVLSSTLTWIFPLRTFTGSILNWNVHEFGGTV